MRVILTDNVPTLGAVGDICTVAPGYGRNYLLPRGMAILATPGALKQIDDLKRTERRRQDRIRYDMTQLAHRVEQQRLEFAAHVGEQGRLYGSITAAQIAHALEAKLGEPIDRHKIRLDESIRTLGDHAVPLHLMPGVDATIHVTVVPEGGMPIIAAEALMEAPVGEAGALEMSTATLEAEAVGSHDGAGETADESDPV